MSNRGEIACRILRTARRIGLRTVAVFDETEASALHVSMAHEAYSLGPPPAANTFLNAQKILSVAQQSGADTIHPGYGFLSENADFADLLSKHALTFVGPSGAVIRLLGNKSESKKLMLKNNIPVIQGYSGEDQTESTLKSQAKKLGYPLLIKAVAGGGGRGMVVVPNPESFSEKLQASRRDAMRSFGDDKVLLERFFTNARHVEVQVVRDGKGKAVHLGTRDCSLQRRYQKIVEEAPAGVPREIREAMTSTAVQIVHLAEYEGAGTVEFMYDPDIRQYFFLEVNTRLQVEHPVTEAIIRACGESVDLVELQLEIAAGKPLPFSQDDVEVVGHAIEARLCAEAPDQEFAPSNGVISYLTPASEIVEEPGTNVRIDCGFRSGDTISMHFDSLIAKVIASGKERSSALNALQNAMRQFHVTGFPTNINLLGNLLRHDAVQKNSITTRFLEANLEALLRDMPPKVAPLLAAAVLVYDSWLGNDCNPSPFAFFV